MEQFVVSARKYRPAAFESVVGQDTISTTLKNAIQRKQLAHAYLFCGPRGVGKTTCARIFAKTINCLNPTPEFEACGVCESCLSFAEGRSYSIHELDAASNNSVEDIRTLTDQVRVPPQIGKYSVYIIDEVHMLSTAAFNAFLKTLEEPPMHAIFILATTEKHKILPTILSRCQIYDFNRISIDGMVMYLTDIAQKENVKVEEAALNIIAQKADGAMRDALSLFDQAVVFCGNKITYEAIIKNLHVVDYKYYFTLTNYILEHRHTDALLLFDDVLSKGFDALHFIAGLSEHFRNLLVCKDTVTLKLFESGETFKKDYLEQTTLCSIDFLFNALNITNSCEMSYKSSGNLRLHVELALLRLSNIDAEKKNDRQKELSDDEHKTENEKPIADDIEPIPATVPPVVSAPLPVAMPPKTFSIKNALDGKVIEEAPKVVSNMEEKKMPFSQEQLMVAWNEYIKKISTRQRLVALMQNITPQISDNYIICFSVLNTKQKEWMDKDIMPDMTAFLRQILQNNLISISISVEENITKESTANKMYMPIEKFKYLMSSYPNVAKLQQALDLDVK